MQNPLLQDAALPPFSAITPDHVEPAMEQLIAAHRSLVDELLADARCAGQADFLEPLVAMDERLGNAWSPVSHLNSVADTPELREAYNKARQKIAAYTTELGQNRALFERYQSLRDGHAFAGLSALQQRAVDLALRDFRLSGVALEGDERERYAQIRQRLSELSARFSENVLDATDAWHLQLTDEQRLAGLPDQARVAAKAAAAAKDLEGWLITLDMPCFHAVMTYGDDRELRSEVYRAFVTRASDQGPDAGRWDNSAVMAEILALRHEAATLLGFANWAEYSLATKMAESPQQVLAFLGDLAGRSQAAAQSEYQQLLDFAARELGLTDLQPWDVQWAGEKLRAAHFSVSDDELRPYFALPRVLEGLLTVAQRLFGVRFRERDDVDVWHADVRYFDVLPAGAEQGAAEDDTVIAGFYLDPSARPGKRGGAWMDICRNRSGASNPVAYLTCNFSPASEDQVALLTHAEVTTLFHEFGHGLHLMLTAVDFSPVGGLNAVEWDAVELPSQLLENWVWEKSALDLFAHHFETGEVMPDALYQRLAATRTFQAAMKLTRQLEFALFDFHLHADYDPNQEPDLMAVLAAVREQVALFPVPEWHRFPHAFSHIFGGGYAAGYYSYLWAEVMAQDAFSAFAEAGVFDAECGARFRNEVLAVGSSRPAADSYRAFRGRDPDIGPLLQSYGLA